MANLTTNNIPVPTLKPRRPAADTPPVPKSRPVQPRTNLDSGQFKPGTDLERLQTMVDRARSEAEPETEVMEGLYKAYGTGDDSTTIADENRQQFEELSEREQAQYYKEFTSKLGVGETRSVLRDHDSCPLYAEQYDRRQQALANGASPNSTELYNVQDQNAARDAIAGDPGCVRALGAASADIGGFRHRDGRAHQRQVNSAVDLGTRDFRQQFVDHRQGNPVRK